MNQREMFERDLANFDATFEKMDAVHTLPDGFAFIDTEIAPAGLVRAYEGLLSFGYANGYLS